MLHLPQDVQLCIVEYLFIETLTAPEQYDDWRIAIKALSSLCLTSRGLCALAQPLLFRNFVRLSKALGTDVPEMALCDIGVKATETLELFIRTLLDRPDLANQVCSICLQERADEKRDDDTDSEQFLACCIDSPEIPDDYETFDGYKTDQMPEKTTRILDETLLDRFLDSTRRIPAFDSESLDHDWHDTWRLGLAEGRDDATIALLLTLVPNLKHLDIESAQSTFNPHLGMLIKRLVGVASWAKDEKSSTANVPGFKLVVSMPLSQTSLPFLPQLEDLTLRKEHWPGRDTNELYMPLMFVPTLKSLNLIGMYDFFKHDPANYQMPPLINLQHLRVEGFDTDSSGLLKLMKSCSQLQSFEYIPSRFDFIPYFGHDWVEALTEKANALKRLRLQSQLPLQLILPSDGGYQDDTIDLSDELNLQSFSKLVSLEISQMILLPESGPQDAELSDLLPSSLESLIVRDVDAISTTLLSKFIEKGGSRNFPRLRYIELVEAEHFAKLCSNNTEPSESSDMDKMQWPVIRARFIEMCQDAGIRYKIWSEAAKWRVDEGKDYIDWPEDVRAHFSAGVDQMKS